MLNGMILRWGERLDAVCRMQIGCGGDYAGEPVRCIESIDVKAREEKERPDSCHEESNLSSRSILFERHLNVLRRS
jgi:hypothetical protein